MNNFKQGSKLNLRFNTPRGVLTMEQLWHLPMVELATVIKSLKKAITKDNDDDLSFLSDSNPSDPITELRFSIVKDIYLDKKEELEVEKNKADAKIHNQKILEIIRRKQDGALEEKSIEELEKLLKTD